MILLDTNVLSELMRPAPAPQVLAWLDRQAPSQVYLCATVRAEIELGIALLPDGRKRQALCSVAQSMFQEEFAGRCLPFDESAAVRYAEIVAVRLRTGRPISVEDAQIAATALSCDLTLASRNVRDFSGIPGLRLVDPWAMTP
jgi:predicted nucleic acid-binding protein